MIYKKFKDIQLSRLGMGNMRLPTQKPDDPKSPIDREKAAEVLARAMQCGINYYDTAYIYNDGESEACLGEIISKYPRDSYYLATKFNLSANPDYKQVFEQQCERLKTDRIDFYLLHCIMDSNIDDYLGCGCIEYFKQLKQQGRITYLGFSSHASPKTLERMASAAEWDFAQLQINYFDWYYSTAKQEYEVLVNHNLPIMVMEPVRGGKLASLPAEAEKLLSDAAPGRSPASWALRFVKNLPQVQVVLSGMNTVQQMDDNAATFSDEAPFGEGEQQLVSQAADILHKQFHVPCTACRYCCSDCPMSINIPEYLKVYNLYKTDGNWGLRGLDSVDSQGKPADCIGCESCVAHCPQGIRIPDCLKELAEAKRD